MYVYIISLSLSLYIYINILFWHRTHRPSHTMVGRQSPPFWVLLRRSEKNCRWNRSNMDDVIPPKMSQGRSTPYIGDGHPTFNRESLFHGYINPYYWVDEFIPYGNFNVSWSTRSHRWNNWGDTAWCPRSAWLMWLSHLLQPCDVPCYVSGISAWSFRLQKSGRIFKPCEYWIYRDQRFVFRSLCNLDKQFERHTLTGQQLAVFNSTWCTQNSIYRKTCLFWQTLESFVEGSLFGAKNQRNPGTRYFSFCTH